MDKEILKEKLSTDFRNALEQKDPETLSFVIEELFDLFYQEYPELMEYPRAEVIQKFIEVLEK